MDRPQQLSAAAALSFSKDLFYRPRTRNCAQLQQLLYQFAPERSSPTAAVDAPPLTARVDGITDTDTTSNLERINTGHDTRGENKVMVALNYSRCLNDRDARLTRASTNKTKYLHPTNLETNNKKTRYLVAHLCLRMDLSEVNLSEVPPQESVRILRGTRRRRSHVLRH